MRTLSNQRSLLRLLGVKDRSWEGEKHEHFQSPSQARCSCFTIINVTVSA